MSLYKFFSGFIGYLFRTNLYGGAGYGYSMPNTPPIRSYKLGFSTSTSYPGLLYNQQTVEQYLSVLDMLTEMYMFSIAGVTTRHVSDVIIESMKDKISVSVEADDERFSKKASDFLENYFKEIGVESIMIKIIPDIVYYGSYSFYLGQENQWQNLYDPHCIITVRGDNYKEVGYLVNGIDNMYFIPIENSKILKIGSDDLLLYSYVINIDDTIEGINDLLDSDRKYSRRVKNFSNIRHKFNSVDPNKLFLRKYVFSAAQPLFYYTRMQLREYIMKQVIIALTTLRDILFPLVYTLQYEYPAVSFTVENLANVIEDILNEYVDISGFVGVQGDLSRILNMITYSIRVLPDFKGSIANLTPLDTSKMTEKIDKYKSDLDELSAKILDDIGIPSMEKTTYWDGLRQSERFATRVNSITTMINDSLTNLAKHLLDERYSNYIKKKSYKVNVSLFDASYGRIARMQNAVENISTYFSTSADLLENTLERFTGEFALYYNKDEIINFVKSILRHVFPNIDSIIDWNKVGKQIQAAAEEALEEMGEGGDDDEGGFRKEIPQAEEEGGEAEGEEGGEEAGGEEGEGGGATSPFI
ncbi:MAG: hypothetical protein QXF12_01085 [Candidatus Aenigmatarchaeota archaeon]